MRRRKLKVADIGPAFYIAEARSFGISLAKLSISFRSSVNRTASDETGECSNFVKLSNRIGPGCSVVIDITIQAKACNENGRESIYFLCGVCSLVEGLMIYGAKRLRTGR